jgi:hypothetical protein
MVQIHKKSTNSQVKDLIERYLNKKIAPKTSLFNIPVILLLEKSQKISREIL